MKKNSYTNKELIECGKGKLFGENNAQLPLPPMLMFDRIISIKEDGGEFDNGQIVAEMDIRKDLWFFQCHFEGDPVMPGCLGLDAMWQLVGFYLGWRGGKFTGQVLPTAKKITYIIDLKRVIIRKLVMGIADAKLEVDGRTIYEATDLKVGLFTSTDSF